MKRALYILILLSAFQVHGQIYVPNASFEEWGDSCAVDQAPIGWTNWSPNGGPEQRGPGCNGTITANDGTKFMCLQWASGGAFIEDGISTTINGFEIGETYVISFFARPDDYWSYNEEIFFHLYIDAISLSLSQPIQEVDYWQEVTYSFVASNTAHEIAFKVSDGGGSCSFAAVVVDNLTITKVAELDDELGVEKTRVEVVDILGRKTEQQPNTLLIYVYSDGTTERVFRVE